MCTVLCHCIQPLYLNPVLNPVQLSEDGPAEELEGEEDIATFHEWQLPARDFHGLWESLIFDSGVKQRLLRYAASALLFSDKKVDPQLVSWNR